MKIVLLLSALFAILSPDSLHATSPIDGWHAFTKVCAAHGGPTDAVLMQTFDGSAFSDGETWRVECDDIEFVIPMSWYEAGKAEQKAKEQGKT